MSLLSLLAFSILLGLVHILVAGALVTRTRGLAWNMGSRDGEPPAVSPVAARAQRASANFLETFPFFGVAVVAAMVASRDGWLAVLGAQLYFWARLAYLPIYILGVPMIRSLVWMVAMAGLLLVVFALL